MIQQKHSVGFVMKEMCISLQQISYNHSHGSKYNDTTITKFPKILIFGVREQSVGLMCRGIDICAICKSNQTL